MTPGDPIPKGPGKRIWIVVAAIPIGFLLCMVLALVVMRGCGKPVPPTPTLTPTLTPTAIPTPSPQATDTVAVVVQPTTALPAVATTGPTLMRAETATPAPPGATPTPETQCVVVYAGASGMNLRYGPGTSYDPPLAVLQKGTELRPLAFSPVGYPDGAWILVHALGTGVVGWVSAGPDFVTCNLNVSSLPRGAVPSTPLPTCAPIATCAPVQTRAPMQPPPTPTPTRLVIQLPGAHPNGMALDPVRGRLFVAGRDTSALYALDEKSLRILATIPVGKLPFGVAYLDGYVYVANFGSASVSVIDANSLQSVTTVVLNDWGSEPTHLAADPVRKAIYVAMHGSSLRTRASYVLEIMPKEWRVAQRVPVGLGSFGIAAIPNLYRLFVANRDSFDLVPVDASEFVKGTPVSAQGSAYFVATHWDNQRLYLTHSPKDGPADKPSELSLYLVTLSRDRLFQGLANASRTVNVGDLGANGGFVAIYPAAETPWDGSVWVSGNKQVIVFNRDLTQQLRAFGAADGIGSDPYAIAINPPLGRVYIGDGTGDRVTILSTR